MSRFSPAGRMLNKVLVATLLLQLWAAAVPFPSAEVGADPVNGPLVTSLTPADGTSIVANRELKIKFDEPVRRGTGNISIVPAGTPVVDVASAAVASYNIANELNNIQWESTDTVIIKPQNLQVGSSYYVHIPAGALTGVNTDKPYAGLTGATDWDFTVESFVETPPFIPANGSVNVDADAVVTLSMTFNQPVKRGEGFIQVKRDDNNNIFNSFDAATSDKIAIAGNTLSVTLNDKLSNSVKYYVTIDPGAVKDLDDNPYAGIQAKTVWSFTAEPLFDIVNPTVNSLTPAHNGALGSLTGTLTVKFSERVYKGTGNIEIRTSNNTLFCSIPVGSAAIAVDPAAWTAAITPSNYTCPALTNGSGYKVVIGPQAFRDETGNYFAGIGHAGVAALWSFSVNQDSTAPLVSTYSPAVSATNVAVAPQLSLVFNESVKITPMSGDNAIVFPQSNPSAKVALTLSVDTGNPQKVLLTLPNGINLNPATKYAVQIAAGAISDISNNAFAGILNNYQWIFDTLGNTATPILNAAAMDGSAIVLTFSELLDTGKVPYPGNFFVTVNDTYRTVSSVSVSSNTVRLTLQSGVLVGQTVKVSYTPDSTASRRIQTVAAKEAAAFSGRTVTNNADTTQPKPVSGLISGSLVTLTFNKTLATPASGAQNQFLVRLGTQFVVPTAISTNGSNLLLTLPASAVSTSAVSVTYTPGVSAIRDTIGNLANAFTEFYITNVNDTTLPSFVSASANGNKVTLLYSEGLRASPAPALANFSVLVDGTAATIQYVTVTGNTVELTLNSLIAANQTVIVSYIQSGIALTDLAGNAALPLYSQAVANGTAGPARPTTAAVNGQTLTINFSSALSSPTGSLSLYFTVKANNQYLIVNSVAVSGSTVTLTLQQAAQAGQTVTVTYVDSGNLRDANGQKIASFDNWNVTNSGTGGGVTLPEYLESDGSGGLKLNYRAVTQQSSNTPAGRIANKYTIDGTKLVEAFDKIKTGGFAKPQVSYAVSTAEAGALVAIPAKSFLDAADKVANGIIKVEYGGMTVELPLKAISYSQLLSASGNSITNAELILKIEQNLDSTFLTAIRSQGGEIVGSPVDFQAVVRSNGVEKEIAAYDQYVTRSITLAQGLSADNLTVVRKDEETGEVNYVPTRTETSDGATKLVFTRRGNSLYSLMRKNPVNFRDMTGHWANPEVSLLASKLIVEGKTAVLFDPGSYITRADFAEYIARGLGLSGNRAGSQSYKDVKASDAAAPYIGAVSLAGIVKGGTDGNFRPSASITREEMATMLVRATQYAGYQVATNANALSGFKDQAKVSSWASEGMRVSVTAGFIKGTNANAINPQSNATRAEATIMLKRFLTYVKFLQE